MHLGKQPLIDHRTDLVELFVEEVPGPGQGGSDISDREVDDGVGGVRQYGGRIRDGTAVFVEVEMGGTAPVGLFAVGEHSVDDVVKEPALSLGQFGQQQRPQGLQTVGDRRVHDASVAGPREFKVHAGEHGGPAESEVLLAGRDCGLPFLPGNAVPGLPV